MKIPAPFKPEIKNETDVSYFDTDFTSEVPELTPPDAGMYCHMMLSFSMTVPCVAADPKAHVGDGVHFHDFTFAPEAGENFN